MRLRSEDRTEVISMKLGRRPAPGSDVERTMEQRRAVGAEVTYDFTD